MAMMRRNSLLYRGLLLIIALTAGYALRNDSRVRGQDAAPASPRKASQSSPLSLSTDSAKSDKSLLTPQTAIPTDLFDTVLAGGPLMIPIGLCSIIALAFGVERLVMLRRRRVIPKDFVTRFLRHLEQGELDRRTALELCEDNRSPVAEVFAHGVRKWGKPSVEVEQAIIDGGERQVSYLRKHLRILNAVATISPLLGLLGTVIGMIMCFNQIATSSAMGKSEQLAGGIGVALITTAGGLAVAIPALILYMYLAGRIDSLVMEMDSLSQKVVNLISAEGLANPPVPATPRSSRSKSAETKDSKKAVVG